MSVFVQVSASWTRWASWLIEIATLRCQEQVWPILTLSSTNLPLGAWIRYTEPRSYDGPATEGRTADRPGSTRVSNRGRQGEVRPGMGNGSRTTLASIRRPHRSGSREGPPSGRREGPHLSHTAQRGGQRRRQRCLAQRGQPVDLHHRPRGQSRVLSPGISGGGRGGARAGDHRSPRIIGGVRLIDLGATFQNVAL